MHVTQSTCGRQLLTWFCPEQLVICMNYICAVCVEVGKGLRVLSCSVSSWTLVQTLEHGISKSILIASLSHSLLDPWLVFAYPHICHPCSVSLNHVAPTLGSFFPTSVRFCFSLPRCDCYQILTIRAC